MPAQPAYFHRLTEVLEVLRQLSVEWIDRRTLQETLGVSKTVAWRVLRACGAMEGPGGSLVCRREHLILSLEQLQATGRYQIEIHRRARLESQLTQLLTVATSLHIEVSGKEHGASLVSTRFRKLPPGVDLSRRQLTIEFAGLEDFLQKFGAVLFALQNDLDAVREFIESPTR